MAIQTTPHTQTQQNVSIDAMDTDPALDRTALGRGPDADLYASNDGAQTGGTRAFNANQTPAGSNVTQTDSGDESGRTRLPEGQQLGITNNPGEERNRQEKVINS